MDNDSYIISDRQGLYLVIDYLQNDIKSKNFRSGSFWFNIPTIIEGWNNSNLLGEFDENKLVWFAVIKLNHTTESEILIIETAKEYRNRGLGKLAVGVIEKHIIEIHKRMLRGKIRPTKVVIKAQSLSNAEEFWVKMGYGIYDTDTKEYIKQIDV